MLESSTFVVVLRQCLLLIGTIALLLTLVESKHNKKMSILIVSVSTCVALLLNIILVAFVIPQGCWGYVGFMCALIIIPSFVILFLLEKDNIFVVLFNFFTQLLITTAILIFCQIFAGFILGEVNGNEWVEIVFRAVLMTVAVVLERKFLYSSFRTIVENIKTKWNHVSWVPMFAFYLVVALCIFPKPFYLASGSIDSNYSIIDFSIIIVIAYVAIVVVYINIFSTLHDIIRFIKEENDINLMRSQNKYWEQQIEISNSNLQEIKRQTHDLHHHNMVALGYLQNGDIEGAKEYLQNHDKRLEEEFIGDFCINKAVNSVLMVCSQKAKALGIQTKIQTSVPESSKIHETELVGIFANAFENAIEGCSRLPSKSKKFINVTCDYKNGMLYIQFQNSCVDDIEFSGEFPISTKGEAGGTGTKSIAYIVEKHKGMVQFSAKDCVFKTRIVIAV